ncbi:MAG: hypothetical protein F6K00_02565 [Leptolyngbya sp. SIOISBB]|nr:hypothetical protein [Leptolyngbya sp. SIOISBB]
MSQKNLDRMADWAVASATFITAAILIFTYVSSSSDAYSYRSIETGRLSIFYFVSTVVHFGLYMLSKFPAMWVQPWIIDSNDGPDKLRIVRKLNFFFRVHLIFLLNGAIFGEILVSRGLIEEFYFVLCRIIAIFSLVIIWLFHVRRTF